MIRPVRQNIKGSSNILLSLEKSHVFSLSDIQWNGHATWHTVKKRIGVLTSIYQSLKMFPEYYVTFSFSPKYTEKTSPTAYQITNTVIWCGFQNGLCHAKKRHYHPDQHGSNEAFAFCIQDIRKQQTLVILYSVKCVKVDTKRGGRRAVIPLM